jgi:ribosome-associated protein
LAKSTKPALTKIVIDALEDIKAKDIQLVNVMTITSISDYIAIASADSTRQTRALANNVIDKVKEAGYKIYGTEGEQTGEWVLVDCGDVIVHIMQPAIREYYKLEELWREGKLEFPKPKREVKAKAEATINVAGSDVKTRAKTAAKKVAPKAGKKVAPKVTKKVATKVAKKVPAEVGAQRTKPVTPTKIAKVAKVLKVAKVAKKVAVAATPASSTKKTAAKKPLTKSTAKNKSSVKKKG